MVVLCFHLHVDVTYYFSVVSSRYHLKFIKVLVGLAGVKSLKQELDRGPVICARLLAHRALTVTNQLLG